MIEGLGTDRRPHTQPSSGRRRSLMTPLSPPSWLYPPLTPTQRRGLPLAEDVSAPEVAAMTTGFTGADLANMVNEAALLAGRESKEKVGQSGGGGQASQTCGSPRLLVPFQSFNVAF